MEEKTREIADLNGQLEMYAIELEDRGQDVTMMESRLEKQAEQIASLESQLNAAKLKNGVEVNGQPAKYANSQVNGLESSRSLANGTSIQSTHDLQDELEEKTRNLQFQMEENATLGKKYNELQIVVEQRQEELELVKNELNKTMQKHSVLLDQYQALKEKSDVSFHNTTPQDEERFAQYEKQIQAKESEILELLDKMDDQAELIDQLKENMARLEHDNGTTSITPDLQEALVRVEALTAENKELDDYAGKVEQERDMAEDQVELLQKELEQVKMDYETQIESLQKESDQLKMDYEDQPDTQNHVRLLESELEELRHAISNQDKSESSLKEMNELVVSQLQSEIVVLKSELESSRQQLAGSETMESLKQKVVNREDQIDALMSENDDLEREIAKAKEELALAYEEIENLEHLKETEQDLRGQVFVQRADRAADCTI